MREQLLAVAEGERERDALVVAGEARAAHAVPAVLELHRVAQQVPAQHALVLGVQRVHELDLHACKRPHAPHELMSSGSGAVAVAARTLLLVCVSHCVGVSVAAERTAVLLAVDDDSDRVSVGWRRRSVGGAFWRHRDGHVTGVRAAPRGRAFGATRIVRIAQRLHRDLLVSGWFPFAATANAAVHVGGARPRTGTRRLGTLLAVRAHHVSSSTRIQLNFRNLMMVRLRIWSRKLDSRV